MSVWHIELSVSRNLSPLGRHTIEYHQPGVPGSLHPAVQANEEGFHLFGCRILHSPGTDLCHAARKVMGL